MRAYFPTLNRCSFDHHCMMTLMAMVVQVHRGVRGVVKDSAGEPVQEATVVVSQVCHEDHDGV